MTIKSSQNQFCNGSMYIRWFKELTIQDIALVGGKNASLGEMYRELRSKGLRVPNGFALTTEAYRLFIKENRLDAKIKAAVKNLDARDVLALRRAGANIRRQILAAKFPSVLEKELLMAYRALGTENNRSKGPVSVAVRSSATAEDLPDASFAGQQESFLNVIGSHDLLVAVKRCLASLFTDRAISYREAKGFDHFAVALSVGVQRMVRSDRAGSGVLFTLDTESGFQGVVLISAAYGLGEYVVKGRVIPDQYFVFKDGVKRNFPAIISRRLGTKESKLIIAGHGTKNEKVKKTDRERFVLTDAEVLELTRSGMLIEEHYKRPMDIEWAKDGVDGKLYIVQARSETVKARQDTAFLEHYKLKKTGNVLVVGVSVGEKIGQGKVRIIESPKKMKEFKAGEILVTRLTDPDWEPVMRIAGAIVTEQGGKTSHAAIVSREFGIPCIVGANKARQLLKPGMSVTVSCAEGEVGRVYKGRLPYEVERRKIIDLSTLKTKLMMNIGDPGQAFKLAALPHRGIGLAREEFIFTNFVKIHPMALAQYAKVTDPVARRQIAELTRGFPDKTAYGVQKLAEGIALIASAFYPEKVVVRLSDFKSNEYATLIGGSGFEPQEENPMLGWRGASRYYSPEYKPGFKIECAAFKKVREEWGLKNVVVMIPFCRTVEEANQVLDTMKEFGLERGKNGLQVYLMCEIPSNVLLAKEFGKLFDGFSIGSNDLTQLTLGVDRDSALVKHIYNENNAAVKQLIRDVIKTAHAAGRTVSICGQAPSDYPEFAEFLVQEGIDSISLNPDTLLKARERIAALEKKLGISAKTKFASAAVVGKALPALGLAGLALVFGGATCQTVSERAVEARVRADVQNQLTVFRADLEKQVTERLAEQSPSEILYHETGVGEFVVRLPADWNITRDKEDQARFAAPDNSAWFMVEKKAYRKVPQEAQAGKHVELFGLPAEIFSPTAVNPVSSTASLARAVIYPEGYENSKTVYEFSGNYASAAEFLGRVTEFKP